MVQFKEVQDFELIISYAEKVRRYFDRSIETERINIELSEFKQLLLVVFLVQHLHGKLVNLGTS